MLKVIAQTGSFHAEITTGCHKRQKVISKQRHCQCHPHTGLISDKKNYKNDPCLPLTILAGSRKKVPFVLHSILPLRGVPPPPPSGMAIGTNFSTSSSTAPRHVTLPGVHHCLRWGQTSCYSGSLKMPACSKARGYVSVRPSGIPAQAVVIACWYGSVQLSHRPVSEGISVGHMGVERIREFLTSPPPLPNVRLRRGGG